MGKCTSGALPNFEAQNLSIPAIILLFILKITKMLISQPNLQSLVFRTSDLGFGLGLELGWWWMAHFDFIVSQSPNL